MRILELGKVFRPATSHTYPPFKKGRYMEEYLYDHLLAHQDAIHTDWVYLPIFWTNLQNQPGFSDKKLNYDMLLQRAFQTMPSNTTYFTIVQHDDGPQLRLPSSTIIFGACTGTIPLPLIYEDMSRRLLDAPRPSEKTTLASFVGTDTTHSLRGTMLRHLHGKSGVQCHIRSVWKPSIPEEDAATFIQMTLDSRFCLAPRGYGRSSFRFFEAMQLDTIPVYVWDDIEWLPYREILDYSTFSISISQAELPYLYDRLRAITKEQYQAMQDMLKQVRPYFTVEGMAKYVIQCVESKKIY